MDMNARSRIFTFAVACMLCASPFARLTAQEAKRPTVALVLEGGSAWGFAHVGVIKVLEELGIPVDIVVGTSMGSIIGALYASGYSAEEIETVANQADWADLFMESAGNNSLSYRAREDLADYAASLRFDRKGVSLTGGVITGNKILRFFDSLLASTPNPVNFDKLPRKFRAVATDISTGERVVFSDGSLPDAMRASMSIPGVFEPYRYQGRYLVDGGVVDNLPIDLARNMGADIVIAVDLFYDKKVDGNDLTRSPILSLARTVDIMTRSNVERQLPRADLVLKVNMGDVSPMDFVHASDIAKLGEDTARSDLAGLQAIRDRTGSATAPVPAYVPPVSRIVVTGGTESENERVRRQFEPIIGMTTDTSRLWSVFSKLDESGRYELVRVRRDTDDDEDPLLVTIKTKKTGRNELKFGFLYDSTVSNESTTGNLDLSPALVIRDLTTLDSELRITGEILDTPDIAASFRQPIFTFSAIEPFFAYTRESAVYLGATDLSMVYQTVSQSAGANFEITPFPGVAVTFGWHYDWILRQYSEDIDEATDVDSASIAEVSFDMERLDSPIFPMSGMAVHAKIIASRRDIGSERDFLVNEFDGSAFLSLNTPFSVAFLWRGGTDFSTPDDTESTAPSFYKPTLEDRRMFPGPLTMEEKVGSHVAAAGLEMKHLLNWKAQGISLPIFVVTQFTVGGVIHDPNSVNWGADVFHGNAAAGIGLRVSDGFGALFRAGVHRSLDREYIPFIAFDIGAIGQ